MSAPADPQRLAALAESLSVLVEHASAADAELLDQEVVVGDRAAQRAVDDLVDDALGALREIAASGRELGIMLGGLTAGVSPSERVAGPLPDHLREGR